MRLQLQARPLFRTDMFTFAYLPLVKICPCLFLKPLVVYLCLLITTSEFCMKEGSNVLSSMLSNSHCCLKALVPSECELGVAGVLQSVSVSKEVNPAQQGSATRLELGDSADDEVRVEAAASGIDDSCKVQRYCILHGQDQDMVQLGSISRTRQSICS
ncbi:unnamed protein product [Prunus armeniaca]|uniref:Uncharacterized protein n=1 Tax=Prunus armeniaca TaxID=36596 RepID=A0A6J5Y054_PRUAR|nr:unnamed protein product [Prunus armeniaca]